MKIIESNPVTLLLLAR